MSDQSRPGQPREDLRRRAEARIRRGETQHLAEKDKDVLIHELRVHQIEMEIQNEELRYTQEQLEKTRDAYMHLYNEAPVGYLTIDRNGIIQRHNHTILEMIGDPEADLRNRHFVSLLTEEGKTQFLSRFRSFFSQPLGKNLEVQLRTVTAQGERRRDIRLSGRSADCSADSTDPCLLLGVTDITDQKDSERRIQTLLGEKDTLMREIHHRVKNNLNTVIAMLNLQVHQRPVGTQSETLRTAIDRVRTMHTIYELLQDTQNYREVDLQQYLGLLIDRIIDGLNGPNQPEIRKALSSVRVSTRRAVSLGIILNELVMDACEHAFPETGEGEREHTVEISLRASERREIFLTVRDNGVGMPVHRSGVLTAVGDGLGLLLVRSQVEQWGGSFAIEPADPGTRFVITLPQDVVPDGH